MNNLTHPLWFNIKLSGQITASISHEIKNCLAIIQEQSGLLEDLLFLQKEGNPLSIEKIEKIINSISRQARRANLIVQNLNMLAHMPDQEQSSISLNKLLNLVISTYKRISKMKNVDLQLKTQSDKTIITQPLILFNLIVSILNDIIAKDPPKTIYISTNEHEININPCYHISNNTKEILKFLKLDYTLDKEKQTIFITLT
ncbi:histidine kinase dimerization/phospho-acceptor domain-containing protein [Desulfonauticus submarinus]